MKKLIIIILFVLMYACQENKVDLLKEGTIIISGKIDNTSKTTHNVVSIIIENIISGKQQTITEKLNSNGEFLIRSNIYHSQDVFFKYGNALKPMLLNPGDSIYVSFDALRLDRTITYTGESAETNNQLNIFFNKFSDYFIKNDDVTSKITKYSPLKYKKAVYLQQIRYDSIFKDFKKETTPNDEVTLWVKNYLKYRCGDDLISIARFPDIEIPKEYWRFTDEYELNNNAALNCTQYQDYVRDYYSICFSRKQNHIREAIKAFNKNNYYSYLSIATDSIMRNFRGISRDLILSYVLYSALDNDYLAVDSVLNNKDISFETKQFRRRIEKEVEKYKLIDYKNMEGINTCNDTCNNFLLNLIQTKYKNKVVYIDIWGPWCPHCLEEMSYSKTIHKEFNNGNIVFLYLCVGSNENSWKKMINEKEIKGEHILLTDDQYSILSSQFNIPGLPWYLIVDKGGRVFNNASRPSSPEIVKVLRKASLSGIMDGS